MGERPVNEVPVSREGAVVALKLVMIVVGAAIFWRSAIAVSTAFHARSLYTARPFLDGAVALLVGTADGPAFHVRLRNFLAANHRPIALVAMMVTAIALVIRYLALGRLFDFLYLESEARDRRAYTGFLLNIMMMLGHAGTIYAVIFLGAGAHASEVPVAMLALLGLNLFWFFTIIFSARRVEREALRGVWYLVGTALTAAVVLFCATWALEGHPPVDPALRASRVILLTAGVGLALCIADGYVQGAVYATHRPAPGAVNPED